jgi:hypothetical protein
MWGPRHAKLDGDRSEIDLRGVTSVNRRCRWYFGRFAMALDLRLFQQNPPKADKRPEGLGGRRVAQANIGALAKFGKRNSSAGREDRTVRLRSRLPFEETGPRATGRLEPPSGALLPNRFDASRAAHNFRPTQSLVGNQLTMTNTALSSAVHPRDSIKSPDAWRGGEITATTSARRGLTNTGARYTCRRAERNTTAISNQSAWRATTRPCSRKR